MIDSVFWKNRKVFLTGHTGFKGSWLSFWLARLGADLTGYALPPEHEKGFYSAVGLENEKRLYSIHGDILDRIHLQQALVDSDAEIVIHMAAQPLVRASYQDPLGTFSTNVIGTAHLLEAIRHTTSVKSVVVVTTDKCYENTNKQEGYVESDRLGGYDPYSSSKACTELLTASYREAFLASAGVGVATARAGNVIGGGDWASDRLIPDLMRSIFNQQTVPIRFPNAIRPWQHVLDPLAGYLQLAQALYENPKTMVGAWNFGPFIDDARPVSWIVEKIDAFWPDHLQWQDDTRPQPHEAKLLSLNAKKAIQELNWYPGLSLEDTLVMTIEWYRGQYNSLDLQCVSAQQLEAYTAKISDPTNNPQECLRAR